jgi:hypothetical protein
MKIGRDPRASRSTHKIERLYRSPQGVDEAKCARDQRMDNEHFWIEDFETGDLATSSNTSTVDERT